MEKASIAKQGSIAKPCRCFSINECSTLPLTTTTELPTTEPPTTEPPTAEPTTTQPVTTTTEPARACDCAIDVCITATSGASDQCGPENWSGHDIEILHNRNVIGILPSGFERQQICIFNDEIDIENDIFELRRTGNAGVSRILFP